MAYIRQILKTPNEELRVTLDCSARGRFSSEPFVKDGALYSAVEVLDETPCPEHENVKTAALMRKAREAYNNLTQYMEKVSPEVAIRIQSIEDAGVLADYIAQSIYFCLLYTSRCV